MNGTVKTAALLCAAALLLSGCGGKSQQPPETYDLENDSLPALTALVSLNSEFSFDETQQEDGENGESFTYLYSSLDNGGQTAQEYAQALEKDYECTVYPDEETGTSVDFSAPSGQALVARPLEGGEEDDRFLLTIAWDETSCSVTPSVVQQADLPQTQTSSITLEEAVAYFHTVPPSYLGLSGSSMDEYLLFPQEGTVFLEDQPCLCINVYSAQTHQFQQSYLLSVPDLQVFKLDRDSGQATPLH